MICSGTELKLKRKAEIGDLDSAECLTELVKGPQACPKQPFVLTGENGKAE